MDFPAIIEGLKAVIAQKEQQRTALAQRTDEVDRQIRGIQQAIAGLSECLEAGKPERDEFYAEIVQLAEDVGDSNAFGRMTEGARSVLSRHPMTVAQIEARLVAMNIPLPQKPANCLSIALDHLVEQGEAIKDTRSKSVLYSRKA